jgi:hypothetical protein
MENTFTEPVIKKPGLWAGILIKPIGCPTFMILGAYLMLFFQYSYHPGFYYMLWAIIPLFFWIPFLTYFFVRNTIFKGLGRRYRDLDSNTHENKRRWTALFAIIIFLNLLVLFKLPLYLGFLSAEPRLEQIVEKNQSGKFEDVPEWIRIGIYGFCYVDKNHKETSNPEIIEFHLADDPVESAFIYSTTGLESISTTGAKGHLWGNWYWKKDD